MIAGCAMSKCFWRLRQWRCLAGSGLAALDPILAMPDIRMELLHQLTN